MSDSIWYPSFQAEPVSEPLKVLYGKGAEVVLSDGRTLIDAISSKWVNIHGHAHPLISKAILDQSLQIEHVVFSGFTHQPAIEFAQKLTHLLPSPLSRVFFSDNGSTAIEIALKIALQYHINNGDAGRQTFVAFEGAYHGETMGAMALGASTRAKIPFSECMFDVKRFPFPETWILDTSTEKREDEVISEMGSWLAEHSGIVAAVIIEPLIQGAGGMRMCRSVFLEKLKSLCETFDILLIFDEVITGFGRTGDYFACMKSEVSPDFLCMSRGITGGYIPFAVTVTSEKVYEAFHTEDTGNTFVHGHAYTANPLGCAAAIANLDIMQTEQKFRKVDTLQESFELRLLERKDIEKVRRSGTVLAFDIPTEGKDCARFVSELKNKFVDHGVMIQPINNTVYVSPPYCVTKEQLDKVYNAIFEVLNEIASETGNSDS